MSKKVLVLLADGFEEVEAVTPIDYLKRAEIFVTAASISNSTTVTGARAKLQIIADTTLDALIAEGDNKINTYCTPTGGRLELSPSACCFDAIVLPGGMPGASNLAACERLSLLLIEMAASGKLICAICASPAIVLAPLGLLSGKRFTCYPGMEEKVTGAQWSEDRVVIDGNIITSRAAGTTGEFSIAIINYLLGEPTAKKISDSVLL